MTLEVGYAQLAVVLRDGDLDFEHALVTAAESVESQFPDDDADTLTSWLWDSLFDRIESHASLSWEGHMVGSGSKILGSVSLTPNSVWMIKVETMPEVDFDPLREYASVEAAREAIPDHIGDLFDGTGVPHKMDLGQIPDPRNWAWGFFLERLENPESGELVNWLDIARIVERHALKALPYETDGEREILLGEYLDIALS